MPVQGGTQGAKARRMPIATKKQNKSLSRKSRRGGRK